MSKPTAMRPFGNEYDPFLQAFVGNDENGHPVTVLSTLARLDVDPWEEATALAALSSDAARIRFEALLLKIRDVPVLTLERSQIARRLTLLLPDKPQPRLARTEAARAPALPFSRGWRILIIVVVLIIAAQAMIFGMPDL